MSNNKKPLVSIVASCYSFEKFIPYFMESVLSQTYDNWELIVTDDHSTDESWEILQAYEKKDSRIKVFQNDRNRHVCHTLNNSLGKATGDYVCVMSCDDAFLPEKISRDVDFMENNQEIGVLYSQQYQIDENNESQGRYCYMPPKNFEQYNLLREMFFSGNKLIIPGMFVRKKYVDLVGPFNPLLRMTQDYEYHIRLLFHAKPAYSTEPLVEYRRMSDNSNLCSNTEKTAISEQNETFFVLNAYLEHIKDYDFLLKIFPEVAELGPNDDKLVPYYVGRLAFSSEYSHIKAFGMQAIYDFMLDKNKAEYLEEKTNFLPKDFMHLASEGQIFRSYGSVEV